MSNTFRRDEPTCDFQYEISQEELESFLAMERLYLYNRAMPCGANALKCRLAAWGVKNVPSARTISRILDKQGLTHARTGHYVEDRR
jgi:hypothetical protein